jgi:hypothetical protein
MKIINFRIISTKKSSIFKKKIYVVIMNFCNYEPKLLRKS